MPSCGEIMMRPALLSTTRRTFAGQKQQRLAEWQAAERWLMAGAQPQDAVGGAVDVDGSRPRLRPRRDGRMSAAGRLAERAAEAAAAAGWATDVTHLVVRSWPAGSPVLCRRRVRAWASPGRRLVCLRVNNRRNLIIAVSSFAGRRAWRDNPASPKVCHRHRQRFAGGHSGLTARDDGNRRDGSRCCYGRNC